MSRHGKTLSDRCFTRPAGSRVGSAGAQAGLIAQATAAIRGHGLAAHSAGAPPHAGSTTDICFDHVSGGCVSYIKARREELLTWGSKPMSSILSASSSARKCTCAHFEGRQWEGHIVSAPTEICQGWSGEGSRTEEEHHCGPSVVKKLSFGSICEPSTGEALLPFARPCCCVRH